jgi:hypothetical protein
MTSQSEIERDKAVVDAFYQAGIEGHLQASRGIWIPTSR